MSDSFENLQVWSFNSSVKTSEGVSVFRRTDVYRPLQYLGSKLRAVETILETADAVGVGESVADLFTGSSVVAQAFAASGRRVLASDAMAFPTVLAGSLLSVGRMANEPDVSELVNLLKPLVERAVWDGDWGHCLRAEGIALEREDLPALVRCYEEMPTAWRAGDEQPVILDSIRASQGSVAPFPMPLMTAFYAGTYFGVRQALLLDSIRAAIDELAVGGNLSEWQESCLLTALLGACSDAVFSAGKHFAQPMSIGGEHSKARVFIDRRIDVWALFTKRLFDVASAARPAGESHSVACKSVEDWLQAPEGLMGISAIYADPPYTAQQYSRFYHVPETLLTQRVPRLQLVRGRLTSGLYPDDRFNSAYSRKSTAERAFRDLIELSRTVEATLLLSYSEGGVSSGNARMMDLQSISALVREIRPKCRISVETLGHEYRQFNAQASSVRDKSGSEYLLVVR